MKKHMIAVAIATSFFVASSAMAAEGQKEISVQGSIDKTSSSGQTSSNTFVMGSLGYYYTPTLVLRGTLMVMGSESAGSDSTTTGVGAGVKYYFGESAQSAWVPFAIAGINMISMTGTGFDASGREIDIGVGVSKFISENVSFDITGEKTTSSLTISGGGTYDADGTRITFGMTARY